MKWIALFLAFVSSAVLAQDTLSFWIDRDGDPTPEAIAHYKRTAWLANAGWRVNDYYLNGILQMSATFETDSFKVKQGPYESFYDDGQRSVQALYLDGHLVGAYQSWFSNGNPNTKGTYAEDHIRDSKAIAGKRLNAAKDSSKIFTSDSLSIKIGEWYYYHKNGQVSAIEQYDADGSLMTASYFEPDGSASPEGAVIERLAQFPGGMDALMRYLSRNIKYPKKDRRQTKSGKAIIQFIVDEEGYVSKAWVKESASPLMDQEALRVVNEMPQWQPARMKNREVELCFNLPIMFKLQ